MQPPSPGMKKREGKTCQKCVLFLVYFFFKKVSKYFIFFAGASWELDLHPGSGALSCSPKPSVNFGLRNICDQAICLLCII